MPHVDMLSLFSSSWQGHPELWCVTKRLELGAFEVTIAWEFWWTPPEGRKEDSILGFAVQPWAQMFFDFLDYTSTYRGYRIYFWPFIFGHLEGFELHL